VIGGALIDGGTFDWEKSGKFSTLTEPYHGFHDMVMTDESSVAAFALRARREGLRDFGASMAPMTAFQILQGLETLHVRMPRHIENARKIVAFLGTNKAVASITYPELESHPDCALVNSLFPNGVSAVVSFEVKGGRAAGKVFIEKLSLFSHLANIGDAKSLVIHPASTTHFRMDADALKAAGISEGTIRLSIGLEHADDLIEDLSRALSASQKT
jgi:O-acetylhomoserine (thiol)-lyase